MIDDQTKQKLEKLAAEIAAQPPFPRRAYTINAVRGDLRIPIHISRDRSLHGFYGSAAIGKYRHSSWGKTPADAFVKIITQLCWTLDKLIVEQNFTGGVANRLQ